MANLWVNGREAATGEANNLLEVLRDELEITSVKDGCAEGACGACTVLVDGKAKNACTQRADKLEGVRVITLEGLDEREREVYAYAFGETGAVQCGFCTPGMVLSAKGLLDHNPTPSRSDIVKALTRNICRCTGYKKIIDAIEIAARFFRENKEIPKITQSGGLDADLPRPDARVKTLGTGIYADDLTFDGMVYGSAVRSHYARARVVKIDTSRALAHKETVGVFTAEDIPGINKTGHLVKDWDVLIAEGDITRYVGDGVALVVVKKKSALQEVMELVDVEYEELTPLTSPEESIDEGAPKIHEGGNILQIDKLIRGENVEEVFKRSAHVVEEMYSLPFTDHAFMEPECAIAVPLGEDRVKLYTGSQNIYDERREIAPVLGIPAENVEIESQLVGGGFGGKEDMSVQHHAALIAMLVKRPAKVKLTRQESLNVHTKRHAMKIKMTTACDEKGKLTAMKAIILSDTGAYASLGGPVLQRACTHAAGPYNYQNVNIIGTAVYTNNPPGGAFRGFGVCQSCFATEVNLNLLAEKVGISPFEIRYINAIKPSDVLPNGQIADESTALVACLDALKPHFESSPRAGIAAAFKNSGLGVGVPDFGRAIISVHKGRVHLRTGAARIGQGLDSVVLQIACETLGLPPGTFVIEAPNTARTPNSGTTTASRQTVFTGEAMRRAAEKLKGELNAGKTLKDLENQEFYGEYEGVTDPMGSDKPNPVSHVAYGYGAQVVILDEKGVVEKVIAAYDVGQVINRKNVEGQIEGGVVMGLGYALTEDFPLKKGVPKVKYGTLGLWRATKTPEIETIIVNPEEKLTTAYGAKGIGEIATIPTAPAVHGAYYKFDGKFRKSLPMAETAYRK